MADENNTGSITDVVKTDSPATIPAAKKQRASRRPKAVAEATGATSIAKAPTGRRKRGEHAGDVKPKSAETQVTGKSAAKGVIKGAGRKRVVKQPEQTATTPVSAADEMADLVQLEEENKRLRETLADKLRAENADLRKRLGIN